jgi:hypothetical protein
LDDKACALPGRIVLDDFIPQSVCATWVHSFGRFYPEKRVRYPHLLFAQGMHCKESLIYLFPEKKLRGSGQLRLSFKTKVTSNIYKKFEIWIQTQTF